MTSPEKPIVEEHGGCDSPISVTVSPPHSHPPSPPPSNEDITTTHCEYCHKKTNQKFASGRFCGRLCLNRLTVEKRQKNKLGTGTPPTATASATTTTTGKHSHDEEEQDVDTQPSTHPSKRLKHGKEQKNDIASTSDTPAPALPVISLTHSTSAAMTTTSIPSISTPPTITSPLILGAADKCYESMCQRATNMYQKMNIIHTDMKQYDINIENLQTQLMKQQTQKQNSMTQMNQILPKYQAILASITKQQQARDTFLSNTQQNDNEINMIEPVEDEEHKDALDMLG